MCGTRYPSHVSRTSQTTGARKGYLHDCVWLLQLWQVHQHIMLQVGGGTGIETADIVLGVRKRP